MALGRKKWYRNWGTGAEQDERSEKNVANGVLAPG